MASVSKQPTGPFSPFAGCAIMLIIVVFFLALVGVVWYSGSSQDREIARFTVDQPVKLSPALPDAASTEKLKQRINDFGAAVMKGDAASLSLTIAELNAVIGLAPSSSGSFTDMLSFKGTKGGSQLIADVCLPMNKLKFWEGKRYAAGEAVFAPEIVKDHGPEMRIVTLTIPGKEVNSEFMERFAKMPWVSMFQTQMDIAAVMNCITELKVTDVGVELTVPKHAPVTIGEAPRQRGLADHLMLPIAVFVLTLIALKMFRSSSRSGLQPGDPRV